MATSGTAHVIAIAMLLLGAVLACGEDPGGTEAGQALPEWLEGVYPPPGAEAAAIREIQVQHNLTAPEEQIRLLIDGTDLTVYSDLDTGELIYDLEDGRAPIEIEPGSHTATVERTRVPEDFDVGVDQVEVLDKFEWEFTVQ